MSSMQFANHARTMKFKIRIFVFLLWISVQGVVGVTDSDRISALEKRVESLEALEKHVESLEATLNAIEPLFVARYGLIRNCLTPIVPHGEAQCEEKKKDWMTKDAQSITPGSKCSVVCNPGYIATPSKDVTHCKEDGFWTVDLQCEIPLVLLSGGVVDQSNNGDSGVELLSFYPTTTSGGCDRNIADMPLAAGSPRSFHNLIYVPPQRVLACNGMTSEHEATCDALTLENNSTWKHHSYPNKPSSSEASMCSSGKTRGSFSNYDCKYIEKGRYGAQSLHVGRTGVVTVGGMVYDSQGHDPTASVRDLYDSGSGSSYNIWWNDRKDLEKKRAFFCLVKVKEGGFLATGGLGRDRTGNKVEQTAEYRQIGLGRIGGLTSIPKISDMIAPRSGHGCTGVPGDEFSVLVSGGTKGFGQTAMADAEIFSWNSNSWKNVASMKTGRFGHAVVAVGEKIFAIGGDDRNPNNILDTIEMYDPKKNTWNIIETKLKKPRTNFGFTLVPHSIFDGCVLSRHLNE
eukprot:GFUD01009677.1.p1 GENE.GFUD01009677.1~~GFUD01009677.1.p1  ORF type:complete len:515 (+),score=81.44 GFUD01009677.1:118-1662(+)